MHTHRNKCILKMHSSKNHEWHSYKNRLQRNEEESFQKNLLGKCTGPKVYLVRIFQNSQDLVFSIKDYGNNPCKPKGFWIVLVKH